MNYARLFETILEFIHEYDLPKPRSINTYVGEEDYAAASLLIDGRNDAPTGVSAEFLWNHRDNGIVTAEVLFDGVHMTVQIYENNDEEAA